MILQQNNPDAVRGIKAQGGRTVLGVSNISFGLPQREIINAAFFSMAMDAGLSAGITIRMQP